MDAWATIAPLYDRQDEYIRYAKKFVQDPTDAEDICHEAFMALKNSLEAGAKIKKPAAFLRTTIRNEARDRNSSADVRRATVPDLATLAEARQEDTAEAALFSVSFNDALGKLSHQARAAFVLCELRGLTQDEASRELGLSQSQVARDFEAARRRLARELS